MEFARQLEAVAHQADAGAALGPAYRIFLEEARPPVGPAERERIDEAKKKYRAAVKANKNNEINLFVAAVQYQEAAAVLERYLPNAPNNAALRYQLAETLYKAREDDRCRKVAEETLQLDAAASHPLLTDEQRRKLHFWQDLPATSALTASTFRRSGQANVGDIAPPGAMPENAGIRLGFSTRGFSARIGEIADEINPVRLEAAAQTDGINSVRHWGVLRAEARGK